jgi:hypothetical protein
MPTRAARDCENEEISMSAARMGVPVTLAVGVLVSVALMAAPSWGATAVTSCSGPLGPGTINGDVSAGAGCHLEPGTTVTGSVTVNPGGSLTTEEHYAPTVKIDGDVTSEGATEILLEHVLIGGDVDVQGTTVVTQMVHGRVNGNVNIQKSSGVVIGLESITVEGNVVMEYNDALLVITEAKIGKNVVVEHNTTVSLPSRLLNIVEVTHSEIEGQVRLNNNSVPGSGFLIGVIAFGDYVRKSLEVSDNTAASPGAVSVGGNVVAGTLTCESNKPPPEDVRKPNTAKKKLGQCELL